MKFEKATPKAILKAIPATYQKIADRPASPPPPPLLHAYIPLRQPKTQQPPLQHPHVQQTQQKPLQQKPLQQTQQIPLQQPHVQPIFTQTNTKPLLHMPATSNVKSRLAPLLLSPPHTILTLKLLTPKSYQKRFACFDSPPGHHSSDDCDPNPSFNHASDNWTKVLPKKAASNVESFSALGFRSFFHKELLALRKSKKCFNCLFAGHVKSTCSLPKRCLVCLNFGHNAKSCPLTNDGDSSLSADCHASHPSDCHASHPSANTADSTPSLCLRLTAISSPDPPTPPPAPPAFQNTPDITPDILPFPALDSSFSSTLDSSFHSAHMDIPPNWQYAPMDSVDQFLQYRPDSSRVYIYPRQGVEQENEVLTRSAMVTYSVHGILPPDLTYRLGVRLAGQFGYSVDQYRLHPVDEASGDFILICPSPDVRNRVCNLHQVQILNTILTFTRWSKLTGMVLESPVYRTRIRVSGCPLHLWNHNDLCTLVSRFGYPVTIAPHFTDGVFAFIRMMVKGEHPANIPRRLVVSDDPRAARVFVHIEGFQQVGDFNGPGFGPGMPWAPPSSQLPPPPPPPSSSAGPSASLNSVNQPHHPLPPVNQLNGGVPIQFPLSPVVPPTGQLQLQFKFPPLPLLQFPLFTALSSPHMSFIAAPFPIPFCSLLPQTFHSPVVFPTDCSSTNVDVPLLQFNADDSFVSYVPNPNANGSVVIEELDSPPPGFDGPPMFVHVSGPPLTPAPSNKKSRLTGPLRRSDRLKSKLDGPYYSAISRAQQIQFTASSTAKPKQSRFKTMEPTDEFIKGTAPPTLAQAQLVLNAAGFDLTPDVLKLLADAGIA